jgi:hypothetical protein
MLPRVENVTCALVAYVLSVYPVELMRDALFVSPKSHAVRAFALVHNLALCVFSAVVTYHTIPSLSALVAKRGVFAALCDPLTPASEWWQVVFYYSKYYEFVDTWIIVLMHKKPSFLQMFHHVGIIVTMHAGVVERIPSMQIGTAFNAAVHTAMYAYYALTTIGVRFRLARYLTQIQLAQFGAVTVAGLGVYVTDSGMCGSRAVLLVVAMTHAYVLSLIALFVRFYCSKYRKLNGRQTCSSA